MAKGAATIFSCTACGAQSPRWIGRCPECGAWSTLVEQAAPSGGSHRRSRKEGERSAPLVLSGIDAADVPRLETGLPEVDRVLGGGLVSGSIVLLGGEPGIGKSTLLLQV